MELDGYLGALGQLPSYDQLRMNALTIRGAELQNQQAEQAQMAAQADRERAIARSQVRNQALAAYQAQPTSKGAVSLITNYPELAEPVKEAWKLQSDLAQRQHLSSLSQVRYALANGRADLAEQVARRHIDASKNSGMPADDDEAMIETIRTNPAAALANIDGLIAAITGPEKYADTVKSLGDTTKTLGENSRAQDLQPGLIRKGLAEADQAETAAQYAPKVIESNLATDEARRRDIASQIDTRAGQLQIARDTLESNVQLKLDEFERNGQRPDPGSVGLMNNAVISGSANSALAEETRNLADQFAASSARGGMFSGLAEMSKGFFGAQDGVSVLRSRYQQLRNSAAIKSLPPGPASDKDIKIAREGFPSPSAPRDYIVSWLRGMAKMQDIVAAQDNARAEWIAGNGNLGPARRDLTVGGVQIPRGTSFGDFQKRASASASRQRIPPRSYMEFAR
ncbi:hypothetical protein ACQKJZ_08845 [Sphingomonas sp. NPDC019816]|uniref:hypothetical protein n=1 Tax=Sphingomonas sp. NPDC019816 TaxID=3390679 RepID=UPI003D08CCA6